jgi:hypothetical protein
MGLTELKDILWEEINNPDNQVAQTFTHRDLDITRVEREEDEFEDDGGETECIVGTDEDDWDDISDLYDVGWDSPKNLKKNKEKR